MRIKKTETINRGTAPEPEKAMSDGAQSLDLAQFQRMMKELEPYIVLWNESRKTRVAAASSD